MIFPYISDNIYQLVPQITKNTLNQFDLILFALHFLLVQMDIGKLI